MRVKTGFKRRRRHKKILKLAKGYYQRRHSTYKNAEESVRRALAYAYRDRKVRKREFRKLWITRINAAVREYGLSYSKFMHLLKEKNIDLNRKVLSQMAIYEPEAFKNLIESVKAS
ncbi:50S ribosomal protein L20 [Hippea maritima]|uniref:Large ribosomal subunit protein bL20 n=1 Tax=Hippea maritima (strain ATCC 700847 / DSM 10411 / MH2) TaxID=760142 RepID=F2LY10_HIPMA|nr:50S ribosomal protein L20 [Hippea maritima]AEA33275.1 50S ribosomal protein L20 [Hippea maritima DSM 10411]